MTVYELRAHRKARPMMKTAGELAHLIARQDELKAKESAAPSCPECKRYNAMLATSSLFESKCRDCGFTACYDQDGEIIPPARDLCPTCNEEKLIVGGGSHPGFAGRIFTTEFECGHELWDTSDDFIDP